MIEAGRITGAVVTVVDITERRRAAEQLQQSEQLFRSIFENAQIGISFFNIETRAISPNRALQEMLGIPRMNSVNWRSGMRFPTLMSVWRLQNAIQN